MLSFLLTLVGATVACQITLPPFPLSYSGLITPYQTNCDMRTNPSFVEALILDLDTNTLSVYHPLVVNAGLAPLVPPITFTMPRNPLVGIWFGSNANAITLAPFTSIQQGFCVYNIGGMNSKDTFGQFGHCNGVAFFQKIKELIQSGVPLNPPIPDLGVASDGGACLTTRDFSLVDMDPSDNVVTTYLVDMATGKTAQNSLVNQNVNPQAVVIKNGSDNLLLATLNAIMGCTGYKVTNLVDPTNPLLGKISSMALDEIHAALRQQKVYAYLPKGDPMVRINGMPSLDKLNAYRQGVFQPVISDLTMADTTAFCAHYTNIQLPRLQRNKQLFIVEPSPDPAISTNLYGFLLNRFSGSYLGLACNTLLDIPNPITLVVVNNLVTDGTIALVPEIKVGLAVDPYLLSWDEYPSFDPPAPTTAAPTTAAPTTAAPATAAPTTATPTTTVPRTPAPTTAAPAQSVTQINTTLIVGLSISGIVVSICAYYCFKSSCSSCNRETQPTPAPFVEQSYVDLEKNSRARLRNLSPARKSSRRI